MADTLERYIAPGEQVVYRASQGYEPCTWTLNLFVVIIVLVPAVAAGLAIFDQDGLAVLATAAVCLVLSIPLWARRVAAADVAVTDRRVLRLDTAQSELDYTVVALADIARVEILRGGVEIIRHDGDVVVLRHPRNARQIAKALSRAAGVAAPSTPRREARIAGGILNALLWFGMAFIGAAVTHALNAEPLISNGFADMVFRVLLTAGAMAAWWLLISLLGLVVVRRFLTQDETRRLILRSSLFFDDKPQRRKHDRLLGFALRLALRFVDFLYRRPAPARPEGHDHG